MSTVSVDASFPAAPALICWQDRRGNPQQARWRSEAGVPPHAEIELVGDNLPPEQALQRVQQGVALLWQGDWVRARHFMQALGRLADRQLHATRGKPARDAGEAFARHRAQQGQRAAWLGRVLVQLTADYRVPLRRAQDVQAACQEAYGPAGTEASLVALRELLAVISAHEWRKKGVPVAAVHGSIHPHYGVFSPVRGEYVGLVANAPLPPQAELAFDIGTGSGVLAAVLARRGVARVIATDQDPRALACAADNLARLGLAEQVEVRQADLFPAGRAGLVVCNPPWLPAQPTSPIEYAVYDPDSAMLKGFLAGLAEHLAPEGEGWLILSDLAEHLGLRSRDQLLDWIAGAGLRVLGRLDTAPCHPKAHDGRDRLHAARAQEVTSLWRLGVAPGHE